MHPPNPNKRPSANPVLAFLSHYCEIGHMPLFTAETAAIAGQKGAIARWTKPRPEPIPAISPQIAEPAATDRRLARVRAQLDLVDTRIEEQARKSTVDGQVLNWLCSAQERLSEQERILAGRPLPGSRRPTPEKPAGRNPGAWLSEPEPPAAPAVAAQVPLRPLGWEYLDPNAPPEPPTGSVPPTTSAGS